METNNKNINKFIQNKINLNIHHIVGIKNNKIIKYATYLKYIYVCTCTMMF